MTGGLPVRVRLTAWFGGMLAISLAGAGVLGWVGIRAALYSAIDRDLRERARVAAVDLAEEVNAHGRDELRAHLTEHGGGEAWQIQDGDGTWLYRAPAAAESSAPVSSVTPGQPPLLTVMSVNGARYRAATVARSIDGRTYTLQVVEPLDPVDLALATFARDVMLTGPLWLIVACAGGYWVSGRALAPVDRMIATARAVTARDLSRRVPVPPASDELRRLAETLNGMLDRLEEAFERVTRFTADASHELRTPIALIRTRAEVMLRHPRTDEEWRAAVREIQLESERTSELIERLLTLAKMDAARGGLLGDAPSEVFDVRDVVESACRIGAALARDKGLRFSHDSHPSPVEVRGDPQLLERLFVTLFDNAVKYTGEGGGVCLRLRVGADAIAVVIEDTGIGIPAEDLSNIFERFYRSDKARSRDSGGFGLGLAIARSIAEIHGGSISVTSTQGKGSAFRVSLPITR